MDAEPFSRLRQRTAELQVGFEGRDQLTAAPCVMFLKRPKQRWDRNEPIDQGRRP